METCIEKLEKVSAEIDKLFEAITDEENETKVVFDGIIDISKYCNSKYKILWVLKEANDPDGGWDMRDGLKNIKTGNGIKPTAKATFEPIIYTSYGILKDCDTNGITYISEDLSVVDILNEIAFVNVKKLPGGAVNNPEELQKAYDLYGHIVRKQIIDYGPDIVILGGTANLLINDLELSVDFEKELSGIKYWIKSHKLYIRVYHPAYYRSENDRMEYCDEIINVVRAWENIK